MRYNMSHNTYTYVSKEQTYRHTPKVTFGATPSNPCNPNRITFV